jgi:hypothetical protein
VRLIAGQCSFIEEDGVEISLKGGKVMKKNMEERLRAHPGLYERISRLLEVVENAAGDVDKAAEAERRVIEELRQMGQEALQGWAERRQEVVEQAAEADSGLSRKEKKDSTGIVATEKSR